MMPSGGGVRERWHGAWRGRADATSRSRSAVRWRAGVLSAAATLGLDIGRTLGVFDRGMRAHVRFLFPSRFRSRHPAGDPAARTGRSKADPDDAAVFRGEARPAARHPAALPAGGLLRAVLRRCRPRLQAARPHADQAPRPPHGGPAAQALDTYVNKLLAAGQGRHLRPGRAAKPGKLVAASSLASFPRAPRWPPISSMRSATTTSPPSPSIARTARRLARPLDGRVPGGDRCPRRQPAPGPHRPRSGGTAGDRGRTRALGRRPARDTAATPCTPSAPTGSCHELPGYHFDAASGARTVMDALGVLNLEGFGLAPTTPASVPPPRSSTTPRKTSAPNRRTCAACRSTAATRTLLLDPATLRNLEIFNSSRGTREGSLLRRHQPHRHRRRRPAAGTLARGPHPGVARDPSPPGPGRRTAHASPPASPSCATLSGRCATFRAFSAACRTACAIRANSAACATPSPAPRPAPPLSRTAAPPVRRSPAGSELPALHLAPRRGPRRRAAQRSRRRKLHPPRPRRGTGPAPRPHHGQQDLALRPRTHRAGTHRHPQPEGQVHEQRLATTSRSPRPTCTSSPPTIRAPDHGRRRTLRHRGAEAEGKGDLPRRGERPRPREGTLQRPRGRRARRIRRPRADRRRARRTRCARRLGPARARVGLRRPSSTTATCSKSSRAAIPSWSRCCVRRHAACPRRHRGLRAQRHPAGRRRRADRAAHRSQHGRQIDLHPAGRAHHAHGADRLLGAGPALPRRPGRPHLLPRRRRATTSRAAIRPSWSR
jgi:hypothetical protein